MQKKVFLITCLLLLSAYLFWGCGSGGNNAADTGLVPFSGAPENEQGGGGQPTATPTPQYEILATAQNNPFDVETDGTYVYWTEFIGTSGTIKRIKVDGTEAQPTTLETAINFPLDIIINGTTLYYTTFEQNGNIYSIANCNSATPGDSIAVNTSRVLQYPAFMANDITANNRIFVTECNQGSGRISSVNTATNTVTNITTATLSYPWAIKYDTANNYVYFSEWDGSWTGTTSSGRIKYIDVTGGGPYIVNLIGAATAIIAPSDIEIDALGHVFWTEFTASGNIKYANIADPDTVFTMSSAQDSPFGLILHGGTTIYFGQAVNGGDINSVTFTTPTVTAIVDAAIIGVCRFTQTGSTLIWSDYKYQNSTSSGRILKDTI